MTWTAFFGWDLSLDLVEKADELLMPMLLHAASDDLAFEHVEGGKQGSGAVAFVVVCHSGGAPLLEGQARLGAIERLDLALLVDREHDGMLGWIDVKPHHVMQLLDEVGVVRELELPDAMRLQPVRSPDTLNRAGADAGLFAIMVAVQCVASPGGSVCVSATTRAATSAPSGGMREGRVLSRSRPSKPSCIKRSCQRQTQVLDLPVWCMISLVPSPSALNKTISARHTCVCGTLRSRTSASKRKRSDGVTMIEIPVRMGQIRMQSAARESLGGFKCQI